MNGNLYSPQPVNAGKSSEAQEPRTLSFLKATTVELAIIFVGFNVIVLVFNYFNIIPVSQKFPKYFTWLPHQTVPSTINQPSTLPTAIPNLTINPKMVELPIALDKPQIRNVFANYILTGFIEEINQVEKGVSLQFRDKSIPPFLIGPATEVVREEEGKLIPIKPEDFN